ncbi:MAG: 30S ribosome-binding factor RbfA [Rickettsiales bacterium]
MSKSKAPSNRQLKVGETIKRELSLILTKELHDPVFESLHLTVTEVRMSPDLKYAEAFVVPMIGRPADVDKLIRFLNDISYKMRNIINKKVKLRFSPEIKFRYDDSFDTAHKMNNLLNE